MAVTIPPWLEPADTIKAASAGGQMGNELGRRTDAAMQFDREMAMKGQQFAQNMALEQARAQAQAAQVARSLLLERQRIEIARQEQARLSQQMAIDAAKADLELNLKRQEMFDKYQDRNAPAQFAQVPGSKSQLYRWGGDVGQVKPETTWDTVEETPQGILQRSSAGQDKFVRTHVPQGWEVKEELTNGNLIENTVTGQQRFVSTQPRSVGAESDPEVRDAQQLQRLLNAERSLLAENKLYAIHYQYGKPYTRPDKAQYEEWKRSVDAIKEQISSRIFGQTGTSTATNSPVKVVGIRLKSQ